jgi:hypothetical protein
VATFRAGSRACCTTWVPVFPAPVYLSYYENIRVIRTGANSIVQKNGIPGHLDFNQHLDKKLMFVAVCKARHVPCQPHWGPSFLTSCMMNISLPFSFTPTVTGFFSLHGYLTTWFPISLHTPSPPQNFAVVWSHYSTPFHTLHFAGILNYPPKFSLKKFPCL